MESSGELGYTSSSHTAQAVVPAEPVAVHLGAPRGAGDFRAGSERLFFADRVGGRCVICAVEVNFVRSCSHDRNRDVES